MKIHHLTNGVQFWYDRATRCWWAARFDAEGNQVGQAEHAASRREIEQIAKELEGQA